MIVAEHTITVPDDPEDGIVLECPHAAPDGIDCDYPCAEAMCVAEHGMGHWFIHEDDRANTPPEDPYTRLPPGTYAVMATWVPYGSDPADGEMIFTLTQPATDRLIAEHCYCAATANPPCGWCTE